MKRCALPVNHSGSHVMEEWCDWCDRPRHDCVCAQDPNGIPEGHWSLLSPASDSHDRAGEAEGVGGARRDTSPFSNHQALGDILAQKTKEIEDAGLAQWDYAEPPVKGPVTVERTEYTEPRGIRIAGDKFWGTFGQSVKIELYSSFTISIETGIVACEADGMLRLAIADQTRLVLPSSMILDVATIGPEPVYLYSEDGERLNGGQR